MKRKLRLFLILFTFILCTSCAAIAIIAIIGGEVNTCINLGENGDATLKAPFNAELFDKITNLTVEQINYQFGELPKRTLFKYVIENEYIKTITATMLLLYIIITALSFTTGIIGLTPPEILKRVLLVGFILSFTQTNAWSNYNDFFVNFFEREVHYIAQSIVSIFTDENTAGSSNLYLMADIMIGKVLDPENLLKILAILFSPIITGWIYVYLIAMGLWQTLKGVLKILVMHVIIYLLITILLALGPIFFATLFFNKTKYLFFNWLGQLAAAAAQYIILFAVMSIMLFLIYVLFENLFSFRVCWKPIYWFRITDESVPFLGSFKFPLLHFFKTEYENQVNFFNVFSFFIITYLFPNFIDKIPDIAQMFTGFKASTSGLVGGISSLASNAKGKVKALVKSSIKGATKLPGIKQAKEKYDTINTALTKGKTRTGSNSKELSKFTKNKATELKMKGVTGDEYKKQLSESVDNKADSLATASGKKKGKQEKYKESLQNQGKSYQAAANKDLTKSQAKTAEKLKDFGKKDK